MNACGKRIFPIALMCVRELRALSGAITSAPPTTHLAANATPSTGRNSAILGYAWGGLAVTFIHGGEAFFFAVLPAKRK